MLWPRVLLAMTSLSIGAVGASGAGYLVYQPQIKNYEIQVAGLTAEVSGLEQNVAHLEQTVSGRDAEIASLTAQVSTLESARLSLQRDLKVANTEVQNYKTESQNYKKAVDSLNSKLSSSSQRLDKILAIEVPQAYRWTFEGQTWGDWNLQIPLSLYVDYRDRPRLKEWSAWINMAKDPADRLYLDSMVQGINASSAAAGFSQLQKANFVIAFVQGLPYTEDEVTTPYNEYPRYPIETLFDRGGDCEDTSILVAALLDRMGYDVALIFLPKAQHVGVGVAVSGASGSYYTYDNKNYFYVETTGDGWQIGQLPPGMANSGALIYPL